MHHPDRYIRQVVVTIAIVLVVYIAWQVRAVFLIVFAGMIIATLLTAIANLLGRVLPLQHKYNVIISILLIVLTFTGMGWWVGDNIAEQFEELREKIPQAIDKSVQWLQQFPLPADILQQREGLEDMSVPLARLAGITGTALGAVANVVLILVIGVYLAVTPDIYHRGLLRLVPPAYEERANNAILAASDGLRLWLIGQLGVMAAVGILVAIGLTILDVPLALSLGLMAALLEFIPFIGPFAFAVLAIMLAFMEDPVTAFHVALLCLLVQQIESNLVAPLIQRRAVALPPVLGLVGVLIFGSLFGIIGVLLATPLMVVVMILVNKLYVEYGLEPERSERDAYG